MEFWTIDLGVVNSHQTFTNWKNVSFKHLFHVEKLTLKSTLPKLCIQPFWLGNLMRIPKMCSHFLTPK